MYFLEICTQSSHPCNNARHLHPSKALKRSVSNLHIERSAGPSIKYTSGSDLLCSPRMEPPSPSQRRAQSWLPELQEHPQTPVTGSCSSPCAAHWCSHVLGVCSSLHGILELCLKEMMPRMRTAHHPPGVLHRHDSSNEEGLVTDFR